MNLKSFLFFIILFVFQVVFSQENLKITNTPQCSANMSRPADSIFIALSLRNTGILLNNIAKSTGKNQTEFIGNGLQFYKNKLIYLTQFIFREMNRNNLPLITNQAEAEQNLKVFNQIKFVNLYFNQSQCLQVNEINNKYSHLFLRGVDSSTLAELARQYQKGQTQASCRPDSIKNDLDLYPVYNFEFDQLIDAKSWNKSGFSFWQSFKLYLSVAWRKANVSHLNNSHYNKLTMMVPFEEEILMLANGCKSIERPECNTDFLSSAEIRNLFTTDREKLTLTSTSFEMKDALTSDTDQTDISIKQQIAEKSDSKKWISDFQKSYMSFASQNIESIYKANNLFSSAYTQKSEYLLHYDLENEFKNLEDKESAFYLCSENRLLNQEQPLSLLKTDINNLIANGHIFDQYLKYGLSVSEMISVYLKSVQKMNSLCEKYDHKLSPERNEFWIDFRPWYNSFMSRYKILSAQKEFKQEVIGESLGLKIEKPLNYVQGLCSSSIDCHRKMTENIVSLNKLLIHSQTFLRTQLQSTPVFNERAEKVACGIYDPFEVSRLNNKKLITDLGSSILFGWTSLPIYLDINYKPKELISFNKLIQQGHITFDLDFKSEVNKSLSLNLGTLINVPCSINISNTGLTSNNENPSTLIFNGLSVNACKGQKNQVIQNTNGSVDEFKIIPKKNLQGCIECSLNFKSISTLNFLNTFAPVRSLFKLIDSIARYKNVKNDDLINLREYTINPKHLVETYNKYGKIPEGCVGLLSKGLSCSPVICESLAIKEFESETGFLVTQIELKSEADQIDKYQRAIISSPSCKGPIELKIKCSSNGSKFNMPIYQKNIKNCQKD